MLKLLPDMALLNTLEDFDSHIKPNIVHNLDVLDFLDSFGHDDLFDLIIIDPPYNIGKDFGNDSDKRELADYISWSYEYLSRCLCLAKNGAPVYVYGYPEIISHLAVKFPIDKQRWLN